MGAAILTRLQLRKENKEISDDKEPYHNILDHVTSQNKDWKERVSDIESVVLYGERKRAGWRIINLRPEKTANPAFLAALCDKRVERDAVLAFRDIALANAKAFYTARESDAQYETAKELERNLAAIRHGYNGPLQQLVFSLDDTTVLFYDNQDPVFISQKMKRLRNMVQRIKMLAEDAIRYAGRKSLPLKLVDLTWETLRQDINAVIEGLDKPEYPVVYFENNVERHAVVGGISSVMLRHLLAKLIYNAILHRDKDANPDRVLLSSEVSGSRIVLKISNLMLQEDVIEKRFVQIRDALVTGQIKPRDTSAEDKAPSGYGLIEAYHCCQELKITPSVEFLEKAKLVISLSLCMK